MIHFAGKGGLPPFCSLHLNTSISTLVSDLQKLILLGQHYRLIKCKRECVLCRHTPKGLKDRCQQTRLQLGRVSSRFSVAPA